MRQYERLQCVLWVMGVCLILVCSRGMAGSFELRVNDVSGLDEPWPLVGGLPFPEGELRDASQIRIIGADGAEIPAQVDVAATWRDGSIRWALVGFTSSPQGKYRVEFGPGVSRRAPPQPIRIDRNQAGGLTVDTGAAVYEFLPDRLLPENARMRETVFLAASGDGAYLVDHRGRMARVAGATAELVSEIVKQGPARAVLRREGWYVTADGQWVARAKVWFYFAAGSPYVRVTHSLILTSIAPMESMGFTGRFWFKAGQRYHLAFTWRTTDGAPGDDGDYAVYVNGNRVTADDFGRGGVLHYWPGRVNGGDLFHRREADQHITIGPLDGTIEQLRISDTIRYQAPFQPPETLSDPDSHTRVQFPLDGDGQGETADSTKLSLEP